MVNFREVIHGVVIHVFKWQENLLNNKVSQMGLFMFRVNNEIKELKLQIPSNNVVEVQKPETKNTDVGLFKLSDLMSEPSLKSLARRAVADTCLFFPQTTQALAEYLSIYLLSNFQFTKKTLFGRRKRRIVIVVDVDVLRIIDPSLDVSVDNTLFQDCNNGGKEHGEEDDDQVTQYRDEVDNEERSMDIVEIEELGEELIEEIGHSFDNSIDTLFQDFNNGEADNEEEYYDQVTQYIDEIDEVLNSYIEETSVGIVELVEGTEFEDDDLMETEVLGVSEAEQRPFVLEIVGELLSFLERTPEIIRFKPIFLHDSKGFKEVEAALEIKEFRGCGMGGMCSICLEEFLKREMVGVTPCAHEFHLGCIFKWFRKTHSCPLCRSVCGTLI